MLFGTLVKLVKVRLLHNFFTMNKTTSLKTRREIRNADKANCKLVS